MARVSKISRYFTVKHNLTFHANCLKRGINLPIYLFVNLSDTPVQQRILYMWLFYYEFLKSFVTFISKGHLLEILITMIYFLCVIIIGENFAEHWLHFTLWYWVINPFTPNNTRPLITLTRCKFSNFIFRGLFFFFFFFFFLSEMTIYYNANSAYKLLLATVNFEPCSVSESFISW